MRQVDRDVEEEGKIEKGGESIFTSDSISIWGNEMFPEKEMKPEKTARNNTPGLCFLLKKYKNGVLDCKNSEKTKQCSRWIGKDMKKSMRYRLLVEKNVYEASIE